MRSYSLFSIDLELRQVKCMETETTSPWKWLHLI